MVTEIRGKSINELVFNALDKIIVQGNRTSSRNSSSLGDCSVIYNAFTSLENPRSRHLGLVGRKNNIFATIAETFWVFSGDDRVDPFLSFFLPRAVDFSDDGLSWRGAYGPRLFKYNQLDDVIEQFRNEGIFTRRAVLYIGTPELDTKESLRNVYNLENTKDRPCNAMLDWFVTPDKKLHMNVKSRSGDVLWGWGSINIFEWTFLHEFMLQILRREIDRELMLGSYNHLVTNLHLYDKTGTQGYDVLENRLKQRLTLRNDKPLIFPKSVSLFQKFNETLVSIWSELIESEDTDYQSCILRIGSIFDVYKVIQDSNLLWDYSKLVTAYICTKNMNLDKGMSTDKIQVALSDCDDEFIQSIEKSSFRKFQIKGI